MNTTKTLSVLALATASLGIARADNFFQASAWAPEPQLVDSTEDVEGIRIQIYGENRNVTGLDIGFAHSTTGDFKGLGGLFTLYNHVGGTTTGVQWGLLNRTEGPVAGWQGGWVNINTAELTGLQTGIVNWNDIDTVNVTGVQLGFVNAAKHVHGVQLGLVNFADTLKGVQIGLWNQVDSRDWDQFDPLPKVFPFVNIGF